MQGDHYVCLSSTPNFDCRECKYEEPMSDIGNIHTALTKIPVIWAKYKLNLTNKMVTCKTYKLNLTNITLARTTCKLNLTNASLIFVTHKLNSWAIWTTYKINSAKIFPTTKVIWSESPTKWYMTQSYLGCTTTVRV